MENLCLDHSSLAVEARGAAASETTRDEKSGARSIACGNRAPCRRPQGFHAGALHDRGAMIFDVLLADAEIGGDVLARMSGERRFHDLLLALGEILGARAFRRFQHFGQSDRSLRGGGWDRPIELFRLGHLHRQIPVS